MSYKISVVTVTKNAAIQLKSTINSVINQSYSNIEYIVIDGASVDKSINVIRENENWITYWSSEPDKGIYDAMNKGIEVASGDWIVFLNAGDKFYDLEVVERIVNQFKSTDVVYFGRSCNVGNSFNWFYPPVDINKHNIHKWLKTHLPSHPAVFFPRPYYKYEKYNLRYKIIGDTEYKLRALNNYPYNMLDEIVAYFEMGGVSTSYNSFTEYLTIAKEAWLINYKYMGLLFNINKQVFLFSKFVINNILSPRLKYKYIYKNIK